MTETITSAWEANRTDETRMIEDKLLNAGFERVDAYRYNSAVIMLRIIDSRFEGKRDEERDALVNPVLDQLPMDTQLDIVRLLTFAPSELDQESRKTLRARYRNLEFEEPSSD